MKLIVEWGKKNYKNIIPILLILSFLVRLSLVYFSGDTKIPYEFAVLIPNILSGRGYSYFAQISEFEVIAKSTDHLIKNFPSAYMPPVYPYFLAGVLSIIKNERLGILTIEIIQALLGSITCYLIYLTTRKIFNNFIGVVSLVISSFYPILAFSSSQISAVTLYCFLAQLSIYLITLVILARNNPAVESVGAGICLGLLILARSETLLFILFFFCWLLFLKRKDQNKTVVLLILITILTVCPWIVRNFIVFGQLTPLTISSGYNLWQGQNEKSEGTFGGYVVPPVKEPEELMRKIQNIVPSKKYELDRDNIYMEEAINKMKSNPGRVINLTIRKFLYYWGGVYFGFEMNYPQVHSPIILIPWFCLLPFFVIGLWKSFFKFRQFIVLYLILLSSTLVSMVFFVLPRYPIFVLPTVIMFSSYGLLIIAQWIQKKYHLIKNIDLSHVTIINY